MEVYTYTPTVATFKASAEQAAFARRYAIRVTPLDGTRKLMSRVCKCGRVQEYDFDSTDTPRNRWEAAHSLERLGGDDWRCAFCKMPKLVKDTASSGGSGGNGTGRTASHRPRKSRKGYSEADIKRMEKELAELCDWLNDVATGEVEATPSMVKSAVSRRDGLAATIRAYREWKAVAA